MKLPGRLALTTLGDLLGALYRARATGVLELVEQNGAGTSHRVYLDSGLIQDVDSPMAQARLGEILRSEGFMGSEALTRLARRLIEEPHKRAGEILVEEGLATADLVVSGLRKQLRSRLDALFRLNDAAIRFHVPRPRAGRAPEPLTPHEFLHGRPRARTRAQKPSPEWTRYRARTPVPHCDPKLARAYQMLGVTPGADRLTISRAFRRLAASTHPDRFPHAAPSERAELLSRFAELSAAYHTLIAA